MFSSCKDQISPDPIEKSGSIKTTVVHSGERTNTITDVSGTVTLPLGNYDIIRPANGANLTLASGVVFNAFDWSYLTSGVTINTPSNANITTEGKVILPTGVTWNSSGGLYNRYWDLYLEGGTYNNNGKHNSGYGVTIKSGQYNHGLTAKMDIGSLTKEGGTSAKFVFNALGYGAVATVGAMAVEEGSSGGFIWGPGQIKGVFYNISGPNSVLTGNSTARICTTDPNNNHFYNGGTFGPGTAYCP